MSIKLFRLWCPVALAAILVANGARGADPDKLALNETVDTRLGLFDNTLRIWKVPRRYTPGRSPYFRPGLPPYRQQPEKAEEQRPPEPEPEVVATPKPTSSSGGSSSDDSDDNGSDSSGDSGGGGGGDDDGGDIGPTPCFC